MRLRILLIGLAAVLFAGGNMEAQAPAPSDPKLIDIQGYQQVLQQYKGKPVLVNFWATWCEPCRDEYPMLNELAKQYAPKGLKVVGVSMDQDGDLILMRRFLARYKPVFPNYRKKKGADDAFMQGISAGWTGTLPTTVFYDKNGNQVGHLTGAGTKETYETWIHSLLGQ